MRGVVELFIQLRSSGPRAAWYRRVTDDAILLHKVDQASGPAVADPQPALQRPKWKRARRRKPTNRILLKVVVNVSPPSPRHPRRLRFAVFHLSELRQFS